MNILVLLRMIPDVVEELEISNDGKTLDREFLRLIPNETDDHALEEALLLKERHGGKVTVVAPDAPELDDVLFACLAKGADRAVKISGVEPVMGGRAAARLMAQVLTTAPGLLPADLILTGVQSTEDLDGLMAPILSHLLQLPYVDNVTQVTADGPGKTVTAVKEFPSAVRAEFDVQLPAVLGIQAAEKPPRYVPVAKVRAVMKSQHLESAAAPAGVEAGQLEILQMAKPEPAEHAEMLAGDPAQVAGKICEILAARGVL